VPANETGLLQDERAFSQQSPALSGAIATALPEGANRERGEIVRTTKCFYSRCGKTILDISGAVIVLTMASPLLLLCAAALWLDSRGPIFYRQWRIGRYGTPYQILKLRTMIQGADTKGPTLTAFGDARITRVGRMLRKTKLDEIPQMLNVLRGEMSLVGPRPETPDHVGKYTLQETNVLNVKPGVTGPAALAYVDEERLLATHADKEAFYVNTLMRQKLQIDLAYCRKLCFLEDLKILFLTVAHLLVRSVGKRAAIEETSASHDLVA
jgi:lipopolysaccharide/colanic/teichoic acid biosynthesis glycosyltransferase